MTANEIRQAFIDYFVSKGHTHVKSAPLIPANDPTLIFTNAGMVQFKATFLGEEKRDYTRAVTSQKCVRAGGKHNDLENVGRTARHHTFFEMLGNFSFGDYFKEDAIKFAWELVTEVYKLPKEKLWATVYTDDDEAYGLWRDMIGVPESRILRLGEKDNFWQMADTGPCGPCSEILIDQGEDMACGPDCGIGKCDCDRYLEIWNLVFMQFDRDSSGKLNPLPKPSIDTGMGLERISAVVQGKRNNYDSDLFTPIIHAIAETAGVKYHSSPEADVSLRVIADHLRAMAFLLSEGVMPSNEGRGYVLRRVMRRAMRHGKLLGITKPFLYTLTGTVADEMGGTYPELNDQRDYVARLVLVEEERFIGTLEHGTKMLDGMIAAAKKAGSTEIPGGELFRLYDTYGFPMDLVQDIADDAGMTLDMPGYEAAMNEQKTRAKASWAGTGEQKVREIYRKAAESAGKTAFSGYEATSGEAVVRAVIVGDAVADSAKEGDEAEIVLDATPFYAESGGQVGDRGVIESDSLRFEVNDTKKPVDGLHVHTGRVVRGTVKAGDRVNASVDEEARKAIARNHTATHILHAALKQVLGDHVKQAGSLVAPGRLRFDFSHFAPMSMRERDRVEEIVNSKVLAAMSVGVEEMETEKAISGGATALFGEKYGKSVRVVSMGDYSTELCGGTHLDNSAEVGLFKLVSESGVAAGVRRIEALTGEGALVYVRSEEDELREVASVVKAADLKVAEKVARLSERARELEKELEKLKSKMAGEGAGDLVSQARDISGVKVGAFYVEGLDMKSLRDMADGLRDRMGSGVVVLGSDGGGKVSLVSMVTKDLVDRIKAGDIIKEVAGVVGGSGGGRPDMAQAGGKDPSKLPEAMEKAYEVAAGLLG